MSPLTLSAPAFTALAEAAAAAWPREACGLVLGQRGQPESLRVEALQNLQDRLHAEDPQRHPRDGRTAYAMHPLKVQRLVDGAEAAGEGLVAVFHSHPEHPSYFSRTDEAAAMPFGAPTFPDASQIVVSVYGGEVRDLKAFHWDGARWAEIEVVGLPALPGPPPGAQPLGEV